MHPHNQPPSSDDPASNGNRIGSALAMNISNLSFDPIELEVHGMADPAIVVETPELIEVSLTRLQHAIDEYIVSNSFTLPPKSLMIALETNPDHVRSKKNLLMFLRSVKFDVAKAMMKLESCLDLQRQLFGTDTLGRSITLDDMDEDSLSLLQSGYGQTIPGRDTSGRSILLSIAHLRHERQWPMTDIVSCCFP